MSEPTSSRPLAATPGALVVVKPSRGWQAFQLGELWSYRELFGTLAVRDIRVRYKQTVLGAAWAILQPLAQMIVFTAFFAAHGFSTEGAPPSIFYFAGLLPWQFFASSVSAAANSLVVNRGLVTKVYFPRLVLPIAAITSALIDFTISFAVLLIIMAFGRYAPSPNIIFLPLFLLVGLAAALAIGLWLAALNVEFRDVQYVIPFLIQFWLFVTPVIYPSSSVSGVRRLLLGLNPMSGVVEGFRWCILGRPHPGSTLLISAASITAMLVTGLLFFRRMERSFADRL